MVSYKVDCQLVEFPPVAESRGARGQGAGKIYFPVPLDKGYFSSIIVGGREEGSASRREEESKRYRGSIEGRELR